jgi:signal transduction histidine kinase
MCASQKIFDDHGIRQARERQDESGATLRSAARPDQFATPAMSQEEWHVLLEKLNSEHALERFLAEVERMSLGGLMVAAVAHEVATPLSVIANLAEMMLRDCERDSAMAAKLNKIVTQAHRISDMTRHMLDFFRHRPTEFADVDLAGLTNETFDLIKHELRKARIQVAVENHLEPPFIWGDRAQLQQVLLNLFVNAIQAMKDGGLLTVRINEQASRANCRRTVLLTVEDTGPGIPPQTIEKMFDFFFTTKTAEGGTGLGLAICKQFIGGHNGTIRAENMENSGARFVIQLPAATAEAARASPSSQQGMPTNFDKGSA